MDPEIQKTDLRFRRRDTVPPNTQNVYPRWSQACVHEDDEGARREDHVRIGRGEAGDYQVL